MDRNVGDDDFTRVEGWITPELELLLQDAADIAEEHRHDHLGIEHVALALIAHLDSAHDGTSTPGSVTKNGSGATFTVEQWRRAIIAAMTTRPVQRLRPQRRTDMFYWHSTDRS